VATSSLRFQLAASRSSKSADLTPSRALLYRLLYAMLSVITPPGLARCGVSCGDHCGGPKPMLDVFTAMRLGVWIYFVAACSSCSAALVLQGI